MMFLTIVTIRVGCDYVSPLHTRRFSSFAPGASMLEGGIGIPTVYNFYCYTSVEIDEWRGVSKLPWWCELTQFVHLF